MITLEKVIIGGFGSVIEPLEYNINNNGINIIFGKNGSGKSTITNAIYWAIFGILLKKGSSIIPYEKIQSESYKGTIVKLFLKSNNLEFVIIRCKDYNGKVAETGDKGNSNLWLIGGDGKIRDKKDTQAAIEKLIGCSPRVFKNSIVFGQKLTRIINETGPEKKKVFEEAFEVSFIQDLKDKTEKAKNALVTAANKMQLEFQEVSLKLTAARDKLKFFKTDRNRFEEKKESTIKSLEESLVEYRKSAKELSVKIRSNDTEESQVKEIQSTKDKIAKNSSIINSFKPLSDQLLKADLEKAKIEGNIQDLEKAKKRVEAKYFSVIEKCPRCNQSLNKAEVKKEKEQIQKEVNKLSSDIKEQSISLSHYLSEQTRLNKELSSIGSLKKEVGSLNITLNKLETSLESTKQAKRELIVEAKEIRFLEDKIKAESLKTYDTELMKGIIKVIKGIKPTYKDLKLELKKLNREIELHLWAINDPLSNKGIKSYIFDTQLALVNKELEKYERTLGFKVNFSIDLDSANKNFEAYIYHEGKIRPYENLSGGQAQLVDIAIAFSIHDVTDSNNPINAIFMDEVFESLDKDNIEKVTELINTKAPTKCIHLITHRDEFLNNSYSGIHLKLKKGVTLAYEY